MLWNFKIKDVSTASLLFPLLRVFLVYYKYLDKLQIKK